MIISGLQTLEMMSFLHNPVVAKPNYRLFVIHKFSNLKVLDFRKVKMRERETASQLFKTKRGKDQLKEIEKKAKTFVPGGNLPAGIHSSGVHKIFYGVFSCFILPCVLLS